MSHTFNVEMVEEHEDGSATFTVSGDKASMHSLFEAFFTQALINGIEHAVESKDHWVAERKLLNAAVEFNKAVWAWEEFLGKTSNAFTRSLMRPLRVPETLTTFRKEKDCEHDGFFTTKKPVGRPSMGQSFST
jgi:hypothetical protein